MFRRPAHRALARVIEAFDAQVLRRCRFLFGGGTRIALDLDEYRESRDLDFLCSDETGYGDLRWLAAREGYAALLPGATTAGLSFPREMRIDQYGIRFPVRVGEATIRVELIREARIGLSPPVRVAGIATDCLALGDVYAEKLLANSDRWADRQVLSRDLVDLAALRRFRGPVPPEAWDTAERAYRAAAREDLEKAIAAFAEDPEQQRRSFEGLAVESPAAILEGVALLRDDLAGRTR